MIDKKIEEAARRNADRYRNYPTLSDEDRDKVSIGSFMDCAKWMQKSAGQKCKSINHLDGLN